MTPEEFISFCKSVKESDPTGNAGESKVYLQALYMGYCYPSISPPYTDDVAIDGMEAGKRLAEKFK